MRRSVALGAVLVIVVGLLGLAPSSAGTLSGRYLQSVNVGLASDGAISSVDLANISTRDGSLKTHRSHLDPGKVSGSLPLSVAVSYLKDGKPGTDLADLKGAKGLVELDVTVTNTTVRPQKITYSSGGAQHDAWALVGTPMTVVGSATLPRDSFARIIQPDSGTPGAHTTNGVVSQPAKGDSTVQWAAMLAPPRLSPSTTFTLVEDAKHFSLPNFSFSARPGLVTDPSVAQTLDSAFGSSGSLVAVENSTIGLIANVTATMAQATDNLQAIRDDLHTNAQVVGSSATSTLTQTASDLDGAATQLMGSLSSLKSSLSGTLSSTGDTSASALRDALQSLIDSFGVDANSGRPVAGPTTPVACGVVPQPADGAPSIIGQLRSVATQVKALSSASGQCVSDLRSSLDNAIGDISTPCPTSSTTLVCRLQSAGSKLDGLAQDIVTRGSHILGEFDPSAVTDVNTALAGLVTAVKDLQNQTGQLTGSSATSVSALSSALTAVDGALKTQINATDPGLSSGIPAALADLHGVATTQADTLGTSSGATASGSSVSSQLARLAAAVCNTPADLLPTDVGYVNSLHQLINGTDCSQLTGAVGVLPAGTTPLAARIDAATAAWQQLADQTDLSSAHPSGLAAEVVSLHSALVDADSKVQHVLSQLSTGNAGGFAASLTSLVTTVNGLYAGSADPRGTCPASATSPAPAGSGPVNDVQRTFAFLSCNQSTVSADLSQLLDKDTPAYLGAAKDVRDSAVASDQARSNADTQLSTLLDGLVRQLNSTADNQVKTSAASLGKQQNALQAEQVRAVAQLDAATKSAIQALATGVTSSAQQQTAAGKILSGELSKVLVDLGSPTTGAGLLGDINSRAGQTDVRAHQVDDAASTAVAFRGVRLADLNAQILEQQQFSRSLASAQDYPPFASSAAKNASGSSVFLYRLPGI